VPNKFFSISNKSPSQSSLQNKANTHLMTQATDKQLNTCKQTLTFSSNKQSKLNKNKLQNSNHKIVLTKEIKENM